MVVRDVVTTEMAGRGDVHEVFTMIADGVRRFV